jgi:Uma2 family endonuclease
MTTATETSIAPDSALIINPRHLGITATGAELAKLFVEFCNRNSDSIWQFELTPYGEIIAMPPTHHPSDGHELKTASRLDFWTDDHGGVARGASSAFDMPVTGGVLCPDASWTSQEKWDVHAHVSGDAHPFCPDFVVEIRSTSDNLAPLHAKMRLYIANGAVLGWLIDARNRRVYIYRAGQPEPELLENPSALSGEDVLPGFTFEVARWIFDRG